MNIQSVSLKLPANLILFVTLIWLSSCSDSFYYYYQMHHVSVLDTTVNKETMLYSDAKLTVQYDFWSNDGSTTFKISNKTDSIIFVNLELSHVIINGMAFPYFNNVKTTITSGSNFGKVEQNLFNARQYNVNNTSIQTQKSYEEQKHIVIPPHSMKYIAGIDVSFFHRNCNFGTIEKSDSVKFSIQNTPSVFSNLIYYHLGDLESSPIPVKNTFWISQINNISYDKFIKSKYVDDCGKQTFNPRNFFPYQAPNRYFLKWAR